MKKKILIIEDHIDTRQFLETALRIEYDVISVETGVLGIESALKEIPDIILLDETLPVLSGNDVKLLFSQHKQLNSIPIIFMVSEIPDKNKILSECELMKPVQISALMRKVQYNLNRDNFKKNELIKFGDLKMSLSHVEAKLGEETIKLTKIEYEILKCLALKSGEVIHRNDIKKMAWKEEGLNTKNRTIDVHIRALRKKTNYLAEHIVSIYGVGYMYRV